MRNYLWGTQREKLGLLNHEDIVPYQIGNAPYDYHYEKHYKTCPVVDYSSEGEYYGRPVNADIVD
ncbi:MAG: hypothetical protein JSV74_03090 [Dehalococcoidia bacterium]|nr:MAG: hypothetical protein JSV74_03090 [Dehalococcoidia bacterium]